MHLKILLPYMIYGEVMDVKKIVIDTPAGSYGYLPNRLDCVSVIAPGILFYESESKGEVYLAVDEGVFVKTGVDVFVSVRNAIGGTDLGHLYKIAEDEFVNLDTRERSIRDSFAKLESNFIRRFTEFEKE